MRVEKVVIESEFITLGQFLKITDIISSGGEARTFLERYEVCVDGEREQRRGRKLYRGNTVTVDGRSYSIS